MKTWDIIKCIKETDYETATKLLEDIFITGYIKGVNRGYENMYRLIKKDALSSDIESSKIEFAKKYL